MTAAAWIEGPHWNIRRLPASERDEVRSLAGDVETLEPLALARLNILLGRATSNNSGRLLRRWPPRRTREG